MNKKLNVVIMSGGKGTRFWPVSTTANPKQYLSLTSKNSLLEETLNRLDGLASSEKRYIVTTKDQKDLVELHSRDKIREKNGIIFEPSGRNTAPCVLLSIVHLLNQGLNEDDVIAILPSDQVIENQENFQKTLEVAFNIAKEQDNIVTIGIPPSSPHTGYGYIHRGDKLESRVFPVKSFVEKPDLKTAKSYLASGSYFWNAGIFVASLGTLINEFKMHSPKIFEYFDDLLKHIDNEMELFEIYNKIPPNSIDYAVMEKSSKILVVEADFDWNDLGSWDALENVLEYEKENINVNAKNIHVINSKGNIIFGQDKKVALIDVKDLVVVCHNDTLLIMPKSSSQQVKNIVDCFD